MRELRARDGVGALWQAVHFSPLAIDSLLPQPSRQGRREVTCAYGAPFWRPRRRRSRPREHGATAGRHRVGERLHRGEVGSTEGGRLVHLPACRCEDAPRRIRMRLAPRTKQKHVKLSLTRILQGALPLRLRLLLRRRRHRRMRRTLLRWKPPPRATRGASTRPESLHRRGHVVEAHCHHVAQRRRVRHRRRRAAPNPPERRARGIQPHRPALDARVRTGGSADTGVAHRASGGETEGEGGNVCGEAGGKSRGGRSLCRPAAAPAPRRRIGTRRTLGMTFGSSRGVEGSHYTTTRQHCILTVFCTGPRGDARRVKTRTFDRR